MVSRTGRWLLLAIILLPPSLCGADDASQFVRQAVQTELADDRNDHSLWIYFENDRKSDHSVKQWVAEARDGSLKRVIETNGQPVPQAEQRQQMESFLGDWRARSHQNKSDLHDDQQAAEMLNMLPQAFLWTREGEKDNCTLLHFKPNPAFSPPSFQARVFAAMEGEMAVDNRQHRIASLQGRLIHDVKIAGGLLASLYAGGTFKVERRQTGKDTWQITETHVHIQGHALIFKSISEEEDDVKTDFKQLPDNTTMQQAEGELISEPR